MLFKNQLKGLFLDLDGTLADSLSVIWQAYVSFLSVYDIPASKEEFEQLNGPPLHIVVEKIKIKHDLLPDKTLLLNQYNEIIDQFYMQVPIQKGGIELLAAAKQQSYILAIVSSNSQERVNKWLGHVGIKNCFNVVVTGNHVTYGKPHPEPYLKALALSNLQHTQVIAVEDSTQGACSALSAKIKTYFLHHQGQCLAPSINQAIRITSLLDLREILLP